MEVGPNGVTLQHGGAGGSRKNMWGVASGAQGMWNPNYMFTADGNHQGAFAGLHMPTLSNWRGELKAAQTASYLQRCVKKTINPNGQYESPTTPGLMMDVERFPMTGTSYTKLRDYGCSVAVNLYLRFNLEAGAIFLLMFIVSLPQLVDSYERNSLRNECRSAMSDNATAVLTGDFVGSYSGGRCGYADAGNETLSIRQNLTEIGFLVMTALGTCEEYNTLTDAVLFSPTDSGKVGDDEWPLSSTPNADFCVGGDKETAIYWLGALNSVIFILFMVRLRRLQLTAARETDKALWTAADYALLIRDLPAHEIADDHDGVPGQACLERQPPPRPASTTGPACAHACELHLSLL